MRATGRSMTGLAPEHRPDDVPKRPLLIDRLFGFFRLVGAARRLADAVEHGRPPSLRDLEILGVAPARFPDRDD